MQTKLDQLTDDLMAYTGWSRERAIEFIAAAMDYDGPPLAEFGPLP